MSAPGSAIAQATARLLPQEGRGPRARRPAAVLWTWLRKLLPFAGIAVLLALWQLVAASGIYTEDQLPGPLVVLRAGRETWASGALLGHVGASLGRFGASYLAAVAIAIPLGLLFGLRPAL